MVHSMKLQVVSGWSWVKVWFLEPKPDAQFAAWFGNQQVLESVIEVVEDNMVYQSTAPISPGNSGGDPWSVSFRAVCQGILKLVLPWSRCSFRFLTFGWVALSGPLLVFRTDSLIRSSDEVRWPQVERSRTSCAWNNELLLPMPWSKVPENHPEIKTLFALPVNPARADPSQFWTLWWAWTLLHQPPSLLRIWTMQCEAEDLWHLWYTDLRTFESIIVLDRLSCGEYI